jgi:predicted nucleic-acid-binding protein
MIALDTNILARAIAEEANADPATLEQQRRARALLSSGQELFVPITVVLELEWVLRGIYEMTSSAIAAVLEDLLVIEGVTVDRTPQLHQALQAYRAGLDLADALHLAQSGICHHLATFDTRFIKAVRRLELQPPALAPKA